MAILIGAKEHNKKKDTMTKIINKNKAVEIIEYFSQFPFAKVISNNNKKSLVVHAGVLPSWSLSDIASANEELTESLKSDPEEFFKTMYSDRSKAISKSTNKKNRRRYLINVFTRMRFLSNNNRLDLKTKVKKSGSKTFKPWFSYEHKALKDVENVIFGHWAALNGVTNHNNIKGIDLGCVWGGSLAAINVEDKSIITVDSR
jgi:bis(5'-nucleosyl)-tetraphosphatase (symmetrical)